MTLKDAVFENLNNAKANGYFEEGEWLHDASAAEIADDMIVMAADIEDVTPEQLIPHIEEWLNEQKSMGAKANPSTLSG